MPIHFKFILFLCIFSHLACHSYLVFHPTGQEYSNPEQMGFSYQNIFLNIEKNVKLNVWKIKPRNSIPTRATILQFHGNGENMSSHYTNLLWLVDHGYELIAFDYRGYGKSSGSPSARGVAADSAFILKEYAEEADSNNRPFIVIGQSLGGYLSMRAIIDSNRASSIDLLVLDGTFLSVRKIAAEYGNSLCVSPLGSLLSYAMVTDSYSPVKDLHSFQMPVLVVHGTNDTTIPFSHGKKLYESLPSSNKVFYPVEGGGHIDWMQFGYSVHGQWFVTYLNKIVDSL